MPETCSSLTLRLAISLDHRLGQVSGIELGKSFGGVYVILRQLFIRLHPNAAHLQNSVFKRLFLYIFTKNSSPKELWEKKIQEIDGEHYYLIDAEWTSVTLSKQYGFNGIPTYFLFNPDDFFKDIQTVLVNGYPLPETYKIEDLRYFMEFNVDVK